MIKKCLLFLLIFGCTQLYAQKDVGGYLHLNLGLASPSGDFGSTDYSNDRAGFAMGGPSFQATLGHKIQGVFGGFVTFSSSLPIVNRDAFIESLNRTTNSYDWTMDVAVWRLTGFNFGPQLSFNMKRSAFDIRGIIGAMGFYSPELNLYGTSQNGSANAEFKQLNKRTTSWTFGGAFCYKYEIIRGFVLLANVEYIYSKPKFTDVQQELYIEDIGLVSKDRVSYSQNFKMFNYQLGCGWVF